GRDPLPARAAGEGGGAALPRRGGPGRPQDRRRAPAPFGQRGRRAAPGAELRGRAGRDPLPGEELTMAALAGSVARRYAKALFELAVDKGTFEAVGQELENLARLYAESRELRQTLENPVFKLSQKRKI